MIDFIFTWSMLGGVFLMVVVRIFELNENNSTFWMIIFCIIIGPASWLTIGLLILWNFDDFKKNALGKH